MTEHKIKTKNIDFFKIKFLTLMIFIISETINADENKHGMGLC